MFRADAAVVVTWFNTASAISGRSDIDAGQTGTYQVDLWSSGVDREEYDLGHLADGLCSSSILCHHQLRPTGLWRSGLPSQLSKRSLQSMPSLKGFFFNFNELQALFNGGNHTGYVDIDPTQPYKNTPKVLAQRSGVPHMVRGRYMFRVDDIVRPAGCSNKTGGTCESMKARICSILKVTFRPDHDLPQHCEHAWRNVSRCKRTLSGPYPNLHFDDRGKRGKIHRVYHGVSASNLRSLHVKSWILQ